LLKFDGAGIVKLSLKSWKAQPALAATGLHAGKQSFPIVDWFLYQ